MHTADTPQGKTKYILHAQQLMVMKMLMKVFFFQVVQDLLCVLVAHLLCYVGQLVCSTHLRGQFTQTTETDTLIHNMDIQKDLRKRVKCFLTSVHKVYEAARNLRNRTSSLCLEVSDTQPRLLVPQEVLLPLPRGTWKDCRIAQII